MILTAGTSLDLLLIKLIQPCFIKACNCLEFVNRPSASVRTSLKSYMHSISSVLPQQFYDQASTPSRHALIEDKNWIGFDRESGHYTSYLRYSNPALNPFFCCCCCLFSVFSRKYLLFWILLCCGGWLWNLPLSTLTLYLLLSLYFSISLVL